MGDGLLGLCAVSETYGDGSQNRETEEKILNIGTILCPRQDCINQNWTAL